MATRHTALATAGENASPADLAASLQSAIADCLADRARRAMNRFAAAHGAGLKSDVAKFLASLCPTSRHIAIAVSQGSVADAARSMGLHRSTIYERLSVIRTAAIAMGLDGYFETTPRQFAPRVGK